MKIGINPTTRQISILQDQSLTPGDRNISIRDPEIARINQDLLNQKVIPTGSSLVNATINTDNTN
jgi:hypothetical protein